MHLWQRLNASAIIRVMADNILYYGDNLDVLRRHVKDETGGGREGDPPGFLLLEEIRAISLSGVSQKKASAGKANLTTFIRPLRKGD